MIPRLMAALAVLVAGGVDALPSQEVWQADLRIQSLDVAPAKAGISIRVFVTSDNDDDARNVRLDLILPVGAGVTRLARGCQPSPSPVANLVARVTCDLGNIPVRGLREVTVVATSPGAGPGRRVAVFVASDTPDPAPANNYAERALP